MSTSHLIETYEQAKRDREGAEKWFAQCGAKTACGHEPFAFSKTHSAVKLVLRDCHAQQPEKAYHEAPPPLRYILGNVACERAVELCEQAIAQLRKEECEAAVNARDALQAALAKISESCLCYPRSQVDNKDGVGSRDDT